MPLGGDAVVVVFGTIQCGVVVAGSIDRLALAVPTLATNLRRTSDRPRCVDEMAASAMTASVHCNRHRASTVSHYRIVPPRKVSP